MCGCHRPLGERVHSTTGSRWCDVAPREGMEGAENLLDALAIGVTRGMPLAYETARMVSCSLGRVALVQVGGQVVD